MLLFEWVSLFFFIFATSKVNCFLKKKDMEITIGSIIIGIIAGFLAGKFMRGEGYGCVWNCILGIVGGFVGGKLFSWLGISWGGTLGAVGTAVIGAVVVLYIASVVRKKK